MNLRELFKHFTEFIDLRFKISYQLNHKTLRGDVREGTLARFLSKGMLPKKYDIGHGEIISPNSKVSKQSDLIIFDQINGVPLYSEEDAQVYPVEIVCGIIEVKSSLSKTELVAGLDNIKSVKEIARDNLPFGIVFAHSLSANSLDSLAKNLTEWEKANPDPKFWPELIVVNGEGIIFHSPNNFSFSWPAKGIPVVYNDLNKETFFSFYSLLIDCLEKYNFYPFSLRDYYVSAGEQIGKYLVFNHDNITDDKQVFRLTETFFDKVFASLKDHVSEGEKELYLQYTSFFESIGYLAQSKVRFYNPTGIKINFDPLWFKNPRLFETNGKFNFVKINGFLVVYPTEIIEKEDVQLIPDKKPEDL